MRGKVSYHIRHPESWVARASGLLFRGASQVCRAKYRNILSRLKAVSKHVTNVKSCYRSASFDTLLNAFRS